MNLEPVFPPLCPRELAGGSPGLRTWETGQGEERRKRRKRDSRKREAGKGGRQAEAVPEAGEETEAASPSPLHTHQ